MANTTPRISHDLSLAREFPVFRVYVRRLPDAPWILQRMLDRWPLDNGDLVRDYRRQPGCVVRSVQRVLIPAVGRAVVEVPFGNINGGDYGDLTEAWDWTGYQIRITHRHDDEETWSTIFWGTVERQIDSKPPAWVETDDSTGLTRTIEPGGMRTYSCVDLWASLETVVIDSHYYAPTPSDTPILCAGVQGYNVSAAGEAANRTGGTIDTGTGGPVVYGHTWPGHPDAETWTDANVVNSVLWLARRATTQPMTLLDTHGILITKTQWPASSHRSAAETLAPILRRERGRGAAFIDWTFTGDDGIAFIRVLPQTLADVVTGSGTVKGATTALTSQAIVLTGDHRIDPQSFSIADLEESRVDEVTTVGAPIRVLVSLSVDNGSLEAGWTSAAETALAALDDDDLDGPERGEFALVKRYLRIKPDWWARVNIGGIKRADYRTTGESAALVTSPELTFSLDTPTPAVRLINGTCCPAHRNIQTAAVIADSTDVMHPLTILQKVGTDYVVYDPSDHMHTVQVQPNGFLFTSSEFTGKIRPLEDVLDNLIFIVAIELPHHVKATTTGPDLVVRRQQMVSVQDAHLWLGHRSSIVGADGDFAAQSIDANTPVIYRDDRPELLDRHAMACEWYLKTHRQASWIYRRCCAMIDNFTDTAGDQPYPRLGHVVATLDVASEELEMESVVSSLSYNNGDTVVQLDWVGLA